MFGIQTVLSDGWDYKEKELHVPCGFLRNAWNLFLPKGSVSVLLSTMSYILQGLSKTELMEQLKEEEMELKLIPFSFRFDPERDINDNLFQSTLNREKRVRKVLIRSGLQYPKNIEEWVSLLIQVGIIIEVNYKGVLFLDMVLEPYPYPEQALKLTDHEIDNMINHRQLLAELG